MFLGQLFLLFSPSPQLDFDTLTWEIYNILCYFVSLFPVRPRLSNWGAALAYSIW